MASTTNSHSTAGFYPSLYASNGMSDDAAMFKASSASSRGGSPSRWSPNAHTDSDASEFSSGSPPASDDGYSANNQFAMHNNNVNSNADWDLLSEMLTDDTVGIPNAPHHPTTSSGFGGGAMGYDGMYGAPPARAMQQHHNNYAPQPAVHQFQHPQHFQHRRPPMVVPTSGFMDALFLPENEAPLEITPSPPKRNAIGSPQTTDLFPPVAMPTLSSAASESSESDSPIPSPQPRSRSTKSSRKSSSIDAGSSSPSGTPENMTPEEAKKLRRRSQIASSVQRHREKKKCLVAALKDDLSSLTAQLTALRSQRKVLHAHNDRLVEWEEEAMTQRRKRKQSEELNQRMKKALFQQTCFVMGMRSIMTNLPAPREMHIHDWLHSYTVLPATARQKEYTAYFTDSKVDMAYQIVMRETDVFAARLTLSNPYFSEIRVLHDGTECMFHEEDVVVKRELSEQSEYVVPGTGQVVKKYTSMFLFEERGNCTMEAFKHVALEATKAVGVFWPSPGYQSNALDTVTLDDGSSVIFSDLHGSMAMVDDQITAADQDVQLEARMLCRVKHTENDTIIAWDYADKDELYPIQGERSIRRDSCGAALVRREPGGKISFRSVCVKMFGPMDAHATAANDVQALTQRRISLQASEIERANQKCTRSVYESLASAFTKPGKV